MTVTIDAADFPDVMEAFTLFPQRAARALSIAINETMRKVLLPLAREQILKEVNYPEGYLTDDRLGITQFAQPTLLEGRVKGRDRPTSLAQFADATGIPAKGQPWIPVNSVEVAPGRSKKIGRAFLVPLNSGNVGLAIRLRPGEKLTGVRDLSVSRELFPGSNIFLLYGPSVDQVFSGVAEDIKPEVMEAMETEFYRQYYRLTANA